MTDMKMPYKPIFIVGCAKSGTTLLHALLSMHPEIISPAPRPPTAPRPMSRQQYLDHLLNEDFFNIAAHEAEKKGFWDTYFPIKGVPLRMGSELTLLNNPLTPHETHKFVTQFQSGIDHNKRIISKQPFNSFRIHALKEIFPDSHIVAIHRDGRDVIASWGTKKGHSFEMLGGHEEAIPIFARKWCETVNHIEKYKDELDVLTIRYEDLTSDPATVLGQILSHCQLKPCDTYDDIKLASRSGRWRRLIPETYHPVLNQLTGENLKRLGYITDEKQNDPLSESNLKFSFNAAPRQLQPCPICDGTNFEIITTLDRHDIGLPTAMCRQCGLVQSNPRPEQAWYRAFYERLFWKSYIGDNSLSYTELYEHDMQDLKGKSYATMFSNILSAEDSARDRPYHTFLDIGGGLGGVSIHLSRISENIRVHCVEPDPELVRYVKKICPEIEFHDDVANIPDGTLDLASMIHVLEHVENPVAYLRQLRRKLSHRGLVYIEVPDIRSPSWSGKDFFHIAHIYTFDHLTLISCLRRAGFEPLSTEASQVPRMWPWAFGLFARPSSMATGLSSNHIPSALIDEKIRFIRRQITPSVMPENTQPFLVYGANRILNLIRKLRN